MPVTVPLVDHAARSWQGDKVRSPEHLLETACPKQWRRCQRLEQGSFEETLDNGSHVTASENGFIWAAYRAYSDHHHLIIRPEDVWFCILTQLSFYINAHTEELRKFFVSHDGKEELEAISNHKDFAELALQMTDILAKNVNDPQLRDWVMPDFTTTTYHDKVVGAVLFMGAMQGYFTYKFTIDCGLPSITLQGTVEDWQKILQRIDMIDQLGEEPKHFASMLRPILQHMVLTFEAPSEPRVKSFWNRIVHHNEVGSGTDYLSGWLTAFCWWNDKGEAKRLQSAWSSRKGNVLFDDVEYPFVDIDSVPLGFASVPVTVDDHGHKYEATMVAGSVGIAAFSSNTLTTSPHPNAPQALPELSSNEAAPEAHFQDTIQPVSGWWIYENEAKEQAEAREAEKRKLTEASVAIQAEISGLGWEKSLVFYESERWNDFMKMDKRLRELEAF